MQEYALWTLIVLFFIGFYGYFALITSDDIFDNSKSRKENLGTAITYNILFAIITASFYFAFTDEGVLGFIGTIIAVVYFVGTLFYGTLFLPGFVLAGLILLVRSIINK